MVLEGNVSPLNQVVFGGIWVVGMLCQVLKLVIDFKRTFEDRLCFSESLFDGGTPLLALHKVVYDRVGTTELSLQIVSSREQGIYFLINLITHGDTGLYTEGNLIQGINLNKGVT